MAECKHTDFAAEVDVHRLEDSGRFQADVRIKCTQCQTPFRFIGLPAGCDLEGAATSVDATEGRFAIGPKGEVQNVIEGGVMGFSVRRAPNEEPTVLRDKAKCMDAVLANHADLLARWEHYKSGPCGCDLDVGYICEECLIDSLVKHLNGIKRAFSEPTHS